jgi:hypothetical protein
MNIIMTGSDFPMTLTLRNDSGTPINISNLELLEVYVYQKKEQVIQSWTLDAGVEVISASQGIVSVILDRENTSGLIEKPMYMEVIYGVLNSEAIDGVLKVASAPKLIANVVNSAANE